MTITFEQDGIVDLDLEETRQIMGGGKVIPKLEGMDGQYAGGTTTGDTRDSDWNEGEEETERDTRG